MTLRIRNNAYTRASKAVGRGPCSQIALPTEEQVDKAVHEGDVHSLMNWSTRCYGPGRRSIGQPDFSEVLQREVRVVDKIVVGLGVVRRQIEAEEDGPENIA